MRLAPFALILAASFSTAFAQEIKIVAYRTAPRLLADWATASSKVKLVNVGDDALLASEIQDADAVIGEVPPRILEMGKKLKWMQITSAGVERVLHLSGSNYLRDSNIVLTNNQIVQGPEIADHAMAMLLALARMLPLYIKDRTDENWRREPFRGIELNGKKALVIGCGGIGQQIAVRAWAHGMKVTCVDPEDIPYSPFIVKVVKPDMLDKELPDTDAVLISAPHTPKSHKMMGPKQFSLMKQNSYFVAVSRGGIYDLPALIKSLDERRLAGAGVDVTDPEPLPQGNALWKFDNVIVTPHIAGRSDQDAARMQGTVRENIRRFADGLPLLNVVDKQKGY